MAAKSSWSLFEADPEFKSYEWDEAKRRLNIEKHGFDFTQAIEVFSRPTCRTRSDQQGEIRFLAIGSLNNVEIAVIYTEREKDVCRIISVRHARRAERTAYRALHA